MSRYLTNRPEWVDKVVPGSVLKSPTGDFRIVRAVRKSNHWRSPSFSFAIRRCSWTRRPYTSYGWGELVRMGYTNTGVVVKHNSTIDKELARNISDYNRRTLYCWDVCSGQVP